MLVDDDHDLVVQHGQVMATVFENLASVDGRVVSGAAGSLAELVRTLPLAGSMADLVLAAWRNGADIELDEERAVFADPRDVIVSGTTFRAGPDEAIAIYGQTEIVATWRGERHANERIVEQLVQPRRSRTIDLSVAAPEVLVTAFYTPAFCADLCSAIEAFAAWSPDPDDPVPGVEFSLRDTPALFAAVERDLDERLVPALRGHWPEFAWCGLADAFVIRYDATDATPSLELHHDVAQISASVKLNDDFIGGALTFPRQGWDNTGLTIGDVVIWPSLVTHPHAGAAVTAGRKYGLTLWFALPT